MRKSIQTPTQAVFGKALPTSPSLFGTQGPSQFTPTLVTDQFDKNKQKLKIQHICAMKENVFISPEELRIEDSKGQQNMTLPYGKAAGNTWLINAARNTTHSDRNMSSNGSIGSGILGAFTPFESKATNPVPHGAPRPIGIKDTNPSPFSTPVPFGAPTAFSTPVPFGNPTAFSTPVPFGAPTAFSTPVPFGNPTAFSTPVSNNLSVYV